MRWRSVGLAAALLATLIAAYFAPPPEAQVAEPTVRKLPTVAPLVAAQRIQSTSAVLSIRARDEAPGSISHGGFAAAPWADTPGSSAVKPVAAPLPASLPVPAAAAPPLPFKVLGRYLESDKPALFLQYNEQNLVVRAGDVVVGQYKVESLDDAALTLLHLPTNQKQTLALSATR